MAERMRLGLVSILLISPTGRDAVGTSLDQALQSCGADAVRASHDSAYQPYPAGTRLGLLSIQVCRAPKSTGIPACMGMTIVTSWRYKIT